MKKYFGMFRYVTIISYSLIMVGFTLIYYHKVKTQTVNMKEFEDIYNWTTNVGDQSPLY